MSASLIPSASDGDIRQRWAALDSENERLVDPSDPLLLDLYRDRDRDPAEQPDELPAAS